MQAPPTFIRTGQAEDVPPPAQRQAKPTMEPTRPKADTAAGKGSVGKKDFKKGPPEKKAQPAATPITPKTPKGSAGAKEVVDVDVEEEADHSWGQWTSSSASGWRSNEGDQAASWEQADWQKRAWSEGQDDAPKREPAQKKQKKEKIPTEWDEYLRFCRGAWDSWINHKNNTGWKNKLVPLLWHMSRRTLVDDEAARCIATGYMEDAQLDGMLYLYTRHFNSQ